MADAPIFRDYVLSNLDANPVVRTVKGLAPLAVRPSRSTPRIVAQKGMFTIHGCERLSVTACAQRSQNGSEWLDCIIVPAGCRSSIKKELLLAGVSYSSLFPDLDGLCREIEYRYSRSYVELEPLPNN
jgi:hypothetical protein